MTFEYLTDKALSEVQRAAIDAGFADDDTLKSLSAGISPAFVGGHLSGSTPKNKLLNFTSAMNRTRALNSGEVPLCRWLRNATLLAADEPQELVFQRALEIASVDGDANSTVAPNDPPVVSRPVDVEALPAQGGQLEVAIDEDDTLAVGFLHTGTDVSRSVGKMFVQRYFNGVATTRPGNEPDLVLGTGWLLAPGLLITNHHVINARQAGEPDAADSDFDLQGKDAKVQFDFFASTATGQVVDSVSCVAHDKQLDYAILRLADDNPTRPALRLRASPITKTTDFPLKERVNVLQHPNGSPMRLGFRNNFVVTGDQQLLSYLTDTAGGSSGSPICDDAWHVAALHRGFRIIPTGPVSVWGKTIHQENYGTPIGQILAHLAANYPAVHQEVMAGQA